jgi:penicillin-binding protein 1A
VTQTAVPSRAARHQQRTLPLRDPRSFLPRHPRDKRPGHSPHGPMALVRKVLKYWWAWLLPLVALAGGTVVGVIYVFGNVPAPAAVPVAATNIIYDANGNQIGTIATDENRVIVPLSEIDENMQNAVLAAEDHDFYEHGGVSYRGVVRAAWANIVERRVAQGGSTITQQYVKLTELSQERTILRKVNEVILAIKLEQTQSKQKILENYLNLVYFGRGAYGVEAAAQAYFGPRVHANNLDPQQAAFLAGIIRNPNFYSEDENVQAAKDRRNVVLATMGELNMLPPGEAGTWMQRNLDLKPRPAIGVASSAAPHFMEKVHLKLIEELGEEVVNRGGLRIHTTLDLKLQGAAEQAVEETIAAGGDAPRVALAAIEPDTGRVVAMYGGSDFVNRPFNYATDASRQAGSTMKPFVLAAALENDVNVMSRFDGSQCIRGLDQDATRELCNFDNASYGMISLLESTIRSANTPFLRLIQQQVVGPDQIAAIARGCGFEATLTQSNENPANLPEVPSLALGAGEVNTVQLTSAFATLANRGVYLEPYIVAQVEDGSGNVVYRHRETAASRQRCMDENTADTVTFALQQALQNGTGQRARIGVEAAGKTGTTNDNVDARFAGYTTDLAASVWLGFDDASRQLQNVQANGEVFDQVTGGTVPAQIWQRFMSAAIGSGRVQGGAFAEPDLGAGEVLNPAPEQPEDGEQEDGEDGDDEHGGDDGDDGEGDEDGDDEHGGQGDEHGGGGGGEHGGGGGGGGEHGGGAEPGAGEDQPDGAEPTQDAAAEPAVEPDQAPAEHEEQGDQGA